MSAVSQVAAQPTKAPRMSRFRLMIAVVVVLFYKLRRADVQL